MKTTRFKLTKRSGGTARELKKLLVVVSRLRGKNGCPWDKAQTHQTLARYLLEEAHETYDLLERGAPDEELTQELGDVLLQVVLHAQLGLERQAFNFAEICRQTRHKMLLRHPHVFGTKPLNTPREVEVSWEAHKDPNRPGGRLGGVPKTLPALVRAERVQDRASAIGFDWEDINGVLDKLMEEAKELVKAQKDGEKAGISSEMGDLLFSVVNLARYLSVSPERALHGTIDKFARRFAYMEAKARQAQKDLSDYKLAELDELWNQAKLLENDTL